MPLETRCAMLNAIGANAIIVGAYSDREGGICPMLAAHRNGGRTSFATFAAAWDSYARAGRRSRPATEREVRTLRTMLAASIATEGASGVGELGEAIAAHRASRQGRAASRPQAAQAPRREASDRDRSAELRGRHGWAWLRPFRRLDEYERALGEVAAAKAPPRERHPV